MVDRLPDRLLRLYPQHRPSRRRSSSSSASLYRFLSNKWYFDELYDVLFVRPSIWLGRLLWKRGDEGTIDRFGPDGAAAAVVRRHPRSPRAIQTGYLYTYALVMLLGVAAAMTWVMAR